MSACQTSGVRLVLKYQRMPQVCFWTGIDPRSVSSLEGWDTWECSHDFRLRCHDEHHKPSWIEARYVTDMYDLRIPRNTYWCWWLIWVAPGWIQWGKVSVLSRRRRGPPATGWAGRPGSRLPDQCFIHTTKYYHHSKTAHSHSWRSTSVQILTFPVCPSKFWPSECARPPFAALPRGRRSGRAGKSVFGL